MVLGDYIYLAKILAVGIVAAYLGGFRALLLMLVSVVMATRPWRYRFLVAACAGASLFSVCIGFVKYLEDHSFPKLFVIAYIYAGEFSAALTVATIVFLSRRFLSNRSQ
jgi:hypothetical protein